MTEFTEAMKEAVEMMKEDVDNMLEQSEIDGIMFDYASSEKFGEVRGEREYRVLNELFEETKTTRWYLSAPKETNWDRGVQDFKFIWVSFERSDMTMWGDIFTWESSDRVGVTVNLG